MSLLIGIDVGTSGLKAIAVRAESGAIAAATMQEYALYTPKPQYAEQDPADYARAVRDALRDLAAQLGSQRSEVRAIGLSGQMHSAVLLGSSREVLRRAMLWCDTRTSEECREIERTLGTDGLARTVCNRALEGFTLPKLLWLRTHEPAVFARIQSVVMPKDFVGAELTGELATDVSDASGTLVFDPRRRAWSDEVCVAFGIPRAWFPSVAESITELGVLRADVARDVGLPDGVRVIRGAADNAAAAVGLGVVRAGRAMVSLGTSGVVLAHTDEVQVEAQMRLHSFCGAVPGRAYLMGVMLAAGGALRWYRDVIARCSYDEINAKATSAPTGSGGLVFLPYLMGERTPHNDAMARGAFVGLSASTGLEAMSRAVFEGISFGLSDSLDLMRACDRAGQIRELRATGGGAKSALWRQMLADVLECDVLTTSSSEGPAFGAAILAGAATRVFASVEEGAEAWVRITGHVSPHRESVERYREIRTVYRALYPDLRARFSDLARLA